MNCFVAVGIDKKLEIGRKISSLTDNKVLSYLISHIDTDFLIFLNLFYYC